MDLMRTDDSTGRRDERVKKGYLEMKSWITLTTVLDSDICWSIVNKGHINVTICDD